MFEYHKIQSIFKRDPSTKHKTFLIGQYSIPDFEYLKDAQWVFTEKVDGTNIRVMWNGDAISFGGKSDNAQIPAPLVQRLRDRFDGAAELFTSIFGSSITTIYAEGYGAKIQGCGANYRQDQDIVAFDVNIGGVWLDRKDVEDVAGKLGIDVVPVLGEGTLCDAIVRTEKGFKSRWGDFIAEGIVARPKCELQTKTGQRIITKVKHRDFTL